MRLLLATTENRFFDDLEAQWQGQLSKYDESLEDYVASFRAHCKKVIDGQYENYWVYLLEDNGAYVAFIHINRARIKRLSGYTIRALEIYLAPVYDYDEISTQDMARICAGVFSGLVDLANNEMPADNIKLHVGPLDKRFLAVFANLSSEKMNLAASIEGSWLVLKKV